MADVVGGLSMAEMLIILGEFNAHSKRAQAQVMQHVGLNGGRITDDMYVLKVCLRRLRELNKPHPPDEAPPGMDMGEHVLALLEGQYCTTSNRDSKKQRALRKVLRSPNVIEYARKAFTVPELKLRKAMTIICKRRARVPDKPDFFYTDGRSTTRRGRRRK